MMMQAKTYQSTTEMELLDDHQEALQGLGVGGNDKHPNL